MKQKVSEKDGELWQKRFKIAEQRQTNLFSRASRFYDILYAVFNTQNIAPWRSKVYVPVLASKAWDLVARLSNVVPQFTVSISGEYEYDEQNETMGYSEDSEKRARRIEKYLQKCYTKMDGEPMSLRVQDTLMDAVVAGTGYAKAPWVLEEKETKARPIMEDGVNVDLSQEVVKTTLKGHNTFEPVNFFNVFVAPNNTGFYSAPWVIVREYKPMKELKESGLYSNLDKVATGSIDTNFQEYNASRNRIVDDVNRETDETTDYVTIYECYDKFSKDIITYAPGNGKDKPWTEIRRQTDAYWHGMFPLVPFYVRKKSYSSFGESLFENNERLQSAVNDLFNHYLDNWNLSIDGMIMYEDNSLTSDFIVMPGGELSYTGEPPKQFKFPEPNPQQLTTVMGVIEQAIEAATVPQYLSGVPDSDLDKTAGTASGIRSITEAATEKIGFMRNNFKQSMKLLGQMWLSNARQYMDATEEIRDTVDNKLQPLIIAPADFQSEAELEIDDDSMTPVSREALRENYLAWTQQMLGLQKASISQFQLTQDRNDILRFNFNEVADELSEKFGVKDYRNFVLNMPTAEEQVANTQKEMAIQMAAQPQPMGGVPTNG